MKSIIFSVKDYLVLFIFLINLLMMVNKQKMVVVYREMLIMPIIVVKPGLGVDPAKRPGPGFYGSTRKN